MVTILYRHVVRELVVSCCPVLEDPWSMLLRKLQLQIACLLLDLWRLGILGRHAKVLSIGLLDFFQRGLIGFGVGQSRREKLIVLQILRRGAFFQRFSWCPYRERASWLVHIDLRQFCLRVVSMQLAETWTTSTEG